MAHRRLSSAEKGKGMEIGPHQPLRAARVKAPAPDNSELIRKHHLTLIGRVTNKTTQKVWSLIPFFTEHWKTEFKPVGSDLGNGMFQFQFEREADLLSVLEQRPYHYARWMIILQRWEPTISPNFPSLIPFWIKVQGLPVHLWTEATIKCIGEDIGLYEKAEITSAAARMRVHVDGLLPLIKDSVVEFPNGDEVKTTLVYERLDKHCLKCLRLDHELKECLVARAEAKALKASQDETAGKLYIEENQTLHKETSRPPTGEVRSSGSKVKEYRNESFARDSYSREHQNSYAAREDRRYGQNYPNNRENRATWRDRGSFVENSTRYHPYKRKENFDNTSRQQVYRQVRRIDPDARQNARGSESQGHNIYVRDNPRLREEVRREESSSSKALENPAVRGIPLQREPLHLGKNAMEVALGEVRDTMLQYTKVADPTESAARQERVRQAEEKGHLERSAARIAIKSLDKQTVPHNENQEIYSSPPARTPVSLRLGAPPANPTEEDMPIMKKKPGRPPGKRKVANSPRTVAGTSNRKRKVSVKPPVC
ncbi:unnamed protein product, partial [Brassica rapa subsp. narinosa]